MDIFRLIANTNSEKILEMGIKLLVEVTRDEDQLARIYVMLSELSRDDEVRKSLLILKKLLEEILG